MENRLRTPVALLMYNRPHVTRRVFAAIREARPKRLLVVADGPRDESDRAKCALARAAVEAVDWPCDVFRDYSAVNLGCRKRVSSGLDWVFSVVDEAIILEDDCLPHPTFFRFCAELLDRFRDDYRVGHITGDCFARSVRDSTYSYYFSRYSAIWGWATWRRAWTEYDVDIKKWPDIRAGNLHNTMFATREESTYFASQWDRLHRGEIDTWDGQWLFSRLKNQSMTVAPRRNLVSNIGFGADATHTYDLRHPCARFPVRAMRFPLRHPPTIRIDETADGEFWKRVFCEAQPPQWEFLRNLRNPHWYGSSLRRTPVLGPLWKACRNRSRPSDTRSS